MLGIAHSSALIGATPIRLRIEAQVSGGIPAFITVGLPDGAVRESRTRIEAALKNSGHKLDHSRILINLAPADLRKEGSALDLAMALSILVGMEVLPPGLLERYVIIGELGLDGSLRRVPGTIIHARAAKETGRALICPAQNAKEATLVRDLVVHPVSALPELVALFAAKSPLPVAVETLEETDSRDGTCFSDVRGQEQAKRAMVIAAVGGHHVLLHGIPGVGKTMLCERFNGILPDLDAQQELEVLAGHSLLGKPVRTRRPPLRAPHHSLSQAALVGGGSNPRPGEISLAHHGVLFLDELGEFPRAAINALRQPLESGKINVSRAMRMVTFEADFQLIAATNPCPCGNLHHPTKRCACSPSGIERYRLRLGGPIADRFDMSIGLFAAPQPDGVRGERSTELRQKVEAARAFAKQQGRHGRNRSLSASALSAHARLDRSATALLRQAQSTLGLSGRATDRALRVARSIADLAEELRVNDEHLAEAIALRHEAAEDPSKNERAAGVVLADAPF